jgi:transcriptional regulator with XRE-family HTH domain
MPRRPHPPGEPPPSPPAAEVFSRQAIAQRLIATREALGISQAELCRRAGIATNTYNQWERAIIRPSLDHAVRLVQAFGLTLDWIYLGVLSGIPHRLAVKITQRLRRNS